MITPLEYVKRTHAIEDLAKAIQQLADVVQAGIQTGMFVPTPHVAPYTPPLPYIPPVPPYIPPPPYPGYVPQPPYVPHWKPSTTGDPLPPSPYTTTCETSDGDDGGTCATPVPSHFLDDLTELATVEEKHWPGGPDYKMGENKYGTVSGPAERGNIHRNAGTVHIDQEAQ